MSEMLKGTFMHCTVGMQKRGFITISVQIFYCSNSLNNDVIERKVIKIM